MAWVIENQGARGTTYFGCFRGPDGKQKSAGSFASRRESLRAANREEQQVLAGGWHDAKLGRITFKQYVEDEWLPSKHLEDSTKAAYASYLKSHFYPAFGDRQLGHVTSSVVQDWVTKAAADGLSARSIRKYHTMLHSIFKRAVRDGLIIANPCEHTEFPKTIPFKAHVLTPDEYERIIDAIPRRYQLMVETAIETGTRWGELIALKPRHIDFLRRTISIEETIIEVSKKVTGDGERMKSKPYPKDNEPRLIGVRQELLDTLAEHIRVNGIDADDLLFTNTAGNPISRNTFRTRVWMPATQKAKVGIRFHDLRHAHASWLLAGGSDLKSVMDRMGHAQIMTTQKYLHSLPEADQKNLDALSRMKRR